MAKADSSGERIELDAALVARLVGAQFPQWASLPIRPVEVDGWDNRTFRLGEALSVRLPSAAAYAAQVEKEQRWLPRLAPHLPLPIPVPVAMGQPQREFPWRWSVYRWLHGDVASPERIADLRRFATTLSKFLTLLQTVDATDGPPPGAHNFFRGGSLVIYDDETHEALARLGNAVDAEAVRSVWSAALAAPWQGVPVWVHGDVAAGNLLVQGGELAAVIDFGSSAVGDPACDLAIAWTLFAGESRAAFRAALGADSATWARGRGWALWKALITLVQHTDGDAIQSRAAKRVIDQVIRDHTANG